MLRSSIQPFSVLRLLVATMSIWVMGAIMGCSRTSEADRSSPSQGVQAIPNPGDSGSPSPLDSLATQAYEIDASQLLAARLPAEEAAQGWIRLFDGQTLFGWEIAGAANFRVEDGCIVADDGDACLICTSIPWRDYELLVEFKAQPLTNSGVFLRTLLDPQDVKTDCYEVNIAPDDNPFPTGGIVQRKRADAVDKPQPFDAWRTMKMRMEGSHLQVTLDDALVCDFDDATLPANGRIGLQHNNGRIEFRQVMLRPLGMESLLDEPLSNWKQYPEMDARFTVTDDGSLHVQGGSGQLETNESFADFVLLAEYRLPTPEINSGIFFRCIPGDQMMGYECQLSNQMRDDNPLMPADCGSGGIFRRQDARLVAGETNQWATVVLAANGASMAAWVNGIQVSDWVDDRQPDENPRKGKRILPGSIMIQGHDPQTDALLKQIRIVSLDQAN